MRNLLVLVLFSFLLEGCFVIGGMSPSWSNHEVGPIITQNDTPQLHVSVGRDGGMIIVPFFLIFFDKKDYGVSLYIYSKEKMYKTIDSTTYIISDLKDNEINKGTSVKTSKEFEQMGDDTSKWRYYRGWAETGYNIIIPRNKRKEDIKLDCTLFLHDINGEAIIKKQNFKLDVDKMGFGIGLFNW
jgi:hypothetical protein